MRFHAAAVIVAAAAARTAGATLPNDFVELEASFGFGGRPGGDPKLNCWDACGKRSGPCETVCGDGGKCCRKGFKGGDNGCLADEGGTNGHHTCVNSELDAYCERRRGIPEDELADFSKHRWAFCGCVKVDSGGGGGGGATHRFLRANSLAENFVEVGASFRLGGRPVGDPKLNCWDACGKRSGPCETVCGDGGKCCRKGFKGGDNGCLVDEGGTNGHHTCIKSEATSNDGYVLLEPNLPGAQQLCEGEGDTFPRAVKCRWAEEGSVGDSENPGSIKTFCIPRDASAEGSGSSDALGSPDLPGSSDSSSSTDADHDQDAGLGKLLDKTAGVVTKPDEHAIRTAHHGILPGSEYCKRREVLSEDDVGIFSKNPWLYCSCTQREDEGTTFLGPGTDNARSICEGFQSKGTHPRSTKCIWKEAGAAADSNPDGVVTYCVPKEDAGGNAAEVSSEALSTLALYIPSALGPDATPDAYCEHRVKMENKNALSNNFMQNPWLFCGCRDQRGKGIFLADGVENVRQICEGGNTMSPRYLKCEWTGAGGEKTPPLEGNPDGFRTLCVPNPTYVSEYATLRRHSTGGGGAIFGGGGGSTTIGSVGGGGAFNGGGGGGFDSGGGFNGGVGDGLNPTVTPWIPPYNLPKDEYCAWRVKLSVEGGHARAHFLENPWLWCGCSKKGAANRGTFLEAFDDPQNAHDVKIACQGDDLRDGLIPRSEKCVWTGLGSDRELSPEANPDGVPTMCVPSPKYAAQYRTLRIATPTWKQSLTIPESAHTIVTPFIPSPNLPHDRYCDERLQMPGGALSQFMENPWMFCGCRVSKDSATGAHRSVFIEDTDGASELCTGKRPGLPESTSPRSSKCDWAGAGEHGNPDSVDTACVPKPEFVNLYAELRKIQKAKEGAATSTVSATAGEY